MKSILLTLLALLVISCDRTLQRSYKTDKNMTNSDLNKQLVREFYKNAIGKKDSDYASCILTDDYIQHNPMVKTGKAGVLEAIEMLKQFPSPENLPKPLMRVIAEGDLVAVHLNVEFAGQKKVVLDIFRLENGLIAEHWDAIQDVTSLGSEAIHAIEGPVIIQDQQATRQNKLRVEEFSRQVLIEGHFHKLPEFISENLIQHIPDMVDSIGSFYEHLQSFMIKEVHRIIAEGQFVVTQSSGLKNDLPQVFYNVYRLENGKIQELWTVCQEVPEIMAHENGMI